MRSPHAILGISADATADEIRTARRELARTHHPDAGGDADDMRRINEATELALARLTGRRAQTPAEQAASAPPEDRVNAPEWMGETRDMPSFTVEALPVETFEALLIAGAELGEIIDDDPPYELRALLETPLRCWCQLDLVPDADGSTVGVSIAPVEEHPLPRLVDVRNAWITALNGLDWSGLDT
jgi:DnaJ domain